MADGQRITQYGMPLLRAIGIDALDLRVRAISTAPPCLDRTEPRAHPGRGLAALLYERLLALGWLACADDALVLTEPRAGRTHRNAPATRNPRSANKMITESPGGLHAPEGPRPQRDGRSSACPAGGTAGTAWPPRRSYAESDSAQGSAAAAAAGRGEHPRCQTQATRRSPRRRRPAKGRGGGRDRSRPEASPPGALSIAERCLRSGRGRRRGEERRRLPRSPL